MTTKFAAALVTLAALAAPPALAQPADPETAFQTEAKRAAAFDFTGTLVRTCVAPQTGPGADVAPGPAPARASWYTDPAMLDAELVKFFGRRWVLVGRAAHRSSDIRASSLA